MLTGQTEPRSCVKVDVAVPNSPYSLCGRKATLKKKNLYKTEPRICVKVEVAVLSSTSIKVFVIFVDVKRHLKKIGQTSLGLTVTARTSLRSLSIRLPKSASDILTLSLPCLPRRHSENDQ